MPVYIYALKDPDTEDMRYVGMSKQPKIRFKAHMHDRSNNRKGAWIAELRAAGKRPILTILEETNKENWEDRERYWIAKGRESGWPLLNIMAGGQIRFPVPIWDPDVLLPFLPTGAQERYKQLPAREQFDLCVETARACIDSFMGYFNGRHNGDASYRIACQCASAGMRLPE
jgi:hypothetical protein